MRKLALASLGLAAIIVAVLTGREMPQVPVLILIDERSAGDSNQVLGIRDAIESLSDRFHLDVATYKDVRPRVENVISHYRLVIVSGLTGVRFLSELVSLGTNRTTQVVWIGHMVFPGLVEVAHIADVLFLPAPVLEPVTVDELESRTRLIQLSGVAHRVNETNVAKTTAEFEEIYGSLGQESENNLGIVLPGDALSEKLVRKIFTEDDARQLAQQIVAVEGIDKKTFVVNGPRTGLTNPETGEKWHPSPHESGQVDRVTLAFVDELSRLGVRDFRLLDFQFTAKSSAFLPLLGLLRRKGRLHVGGDSASMVSESADFARNVVINFVPSMSSVHRKHAQALFQSGRVSLMVNGKLVKPDNIVAYKELPAVAAAREILGLYRLRAH